MKIALRGGHNYNVTGANGIVNEVIEDRKIYPKVIEYLKLLGHEVIDVTPDKTNTVSEDLKYGVSRANNEKVDYFCSIHLNAGGGRGTETLYQSEKGKAIAARISSKISELGFKNRGPKPNARGLYELKRTDAAANIIECFFCDSSEDVGLYSEVGIDGIARAIAEGITGQTIPDTINERIDNMSILDVQKLCNKLGVADYQGKALVEDGINGKRTESARIKLKEILTYILN